jgi:hypothetical protein
MNVGTIQIGNWAKQDKTNFSVEPVFPFQYTLPAVSRSIRRQGAETEGAFNPETEEQGYEAEKNCRGAGVGIGDPQARLPYRYLMRQLVYQALMK